MSTNSKSSNLGHPPSVVETIWAYLDRPVTQTGCALVLAIVGTIVPSKLAMTIAGGIFLFEAYRMGWFSGKRWYIAAVRFIGVTAIVTSILTGIWLLAWRFREQQRAIPTAQTTPSLAPAIQPAPPATVLEKAPVKKHKSEVPKVSSSGNNSPATGTITQGPGSATSFNQQGGITAGTVNIGPQDRHLSENQKAAIVSNLQGKPCRITTMGALSNVEDAQNYAVELLETFRLAGCTVPSTIASLTSLKETWSGIKVVYHDDAIHVLGERIYTPPDTPPGIILSALDSANLGNIRVSPGPNVPVDAIQVTVGGRPK
jgi:hypothetical protein